jgi:mono/diheme cytochrome c family protein
MSAPLAKRLLRWVGIALGCLAVLAIAALAAAYLLSERALRRTYNIPAVQLTIPTDAEAVLEGQRLATVHGCFSGCHGAHAAGHVLFDQPLIGRIVAPNLTSSVRRYSDAQLAVAIRNGVRPDGRSMLVMPAEVFAPLTDADLVRIIAFLKSLPAVPGPGPDVSLGPIGRIGFALGKFKTAAQLAAEAIPPPQAGDEQAAFGRYLARTSCAQCHGTRLLGDSNPDFTSPTLQVVAAYSPEAFAQLLTTGIALGGRELKTMSPWARENLSHLTDGEITALYSYLRALPGTVAP